MNYTPDIISSAIRMLVALIAVLGGLMFLFYFIKRLSRKNTRGTEGDFIKILSTNYIGIKKAITLVEVPGCILVIGISGENMCMLTKIDDVKTLEQIKNIEQTKRPISFSDQLHKFSYRFRHNNDKR
jgi:flagellar biogenesis protein FliO